MCNNGEDVGDAFEAVDCKLVSMSSQMLVASGVVSGTIRFSNDHDAPSDLDLSSDHAISLQAAGGANLIIPWPNAADTVPAGLSLPRTRFVFPRLDGAGAATARVACLFEEL